VFAAPFKKTAEGKQGAINPQLKENLNDNFGFCFFIKSKLLVPCLLPWIIFEYQVEFADVFKFEDYSAYYQNTWKNFFCQTKAK
jgi:hypothetical protein